MVVIVRCASNLESVLNHFYAPQTLWRAKKSHFQASVEMGMKNVDKDAVNTTIGILCYLDA